MKNTDIEDPLSRKAVQFIDDGDITALKGLLTLHPELVQKRFSYPDGGYFKDPYLLWFVADNPIRAGRLPANIVAITSLLVKEVKEKAPESAQQQMDYTLSLVASGRTSRECGVQLEMIDLLIDAGAQPGGGMGALAHGNIAAAKHLINRGAKLTLAVAVCLDMMDDVVRLLPDANRAGQLAAITAAAFYGKTNMVSFLLSHGVDCNGYPDSSGGFHYHATPLHQAVVSGSLDVVKLLVEAGASLDAKDKVYKGTPLGWAEYVPTEEGHDESAIERFTLIADYLRNEMKNSGAASE